MNEEKLCIDGRKRLSMSGVDKIDGYSETHLKLTVNGTLTVVSGKGIKITSYNKATGSLTCDGDFSGISYGGRKTPILKRIFK